MYRRNIEVLKQIDLTLYQKIIKSQIVYLEKEHINHKYKNTINELVVDKYNKKRTIIQKDEINYIKDLNFYIKYIQSENLLAKKEQKYYEKYLFISQNNNRELDILFNSKEIKVAFFVEKSLNDIVSLLHNIDLVKIAQQTKIIFHTTQENDFENKIKEFLEFGFDKRYFVNYISDNRYSPILQEFLHILPSYSNYNFTYSKYLLAYQNSKLAIKHRFNFLKLDKKALKDSPIFYIGSAPSLKADLKHIKRYKDKVIIVAITSVLNILSKEGITPDIVISIDTRIHQTQLPKLDMSLYQNCTWIVSAKSIKYIYQQLPLDKIYLIQTDIALRETDIFVGNSVGEIGLDMILRLGAKEIYMMGFDVSIDKDGYTHQKAYIKKKFQTKASNIVLNSSYDINNDILKVKGNFSKSVYTTRTFYGLLENYAKISKKDNQKIYNLSNGAYIKQTIPLRAKKLNIKSSQKKSIKLKSIRYKKNILKQNLKEIFKQYIQKQKDIKISDTKEFVDQIQKVTFDLIGFDKTLQDSIINQIFMQYFKLINPYIYYISNDKKELKIQDMKLIYKHWLRQIKKIIKRI